MTLNYAFLERANLTDADLSGADQRSAYMEGSNLTGADLSDVKMVGNEFVSDVQSCDTATTPTPRLPGCEDG